ncbi:ATP-binding protein [Streptomyces dangxiongensis]|uniref:histidine kinase n=2 Tax=Streptomyces dangxiongensis TaxID=1442032 RepID=A0A3G2JAE6_9ACTN|nr:ATP-binding protein [Streptomyces dangxiongensis]
MRLAVLPPLAVALGATAAVLFSIRSTGVRTGPTLWAVLAGAVTVAVAGILIAAVAADRAARSVADRVDALRRTAAFGEADLHDLVDALRQGETPPRRGPRRRPPADADDFELLAADLARAHDGAVTAVVRAAQLSSQAGSEQKLEVFVNLARRLQSLVHREISILDDLENEIEDPDLLKGLFHVDHLATRIRRHAENLAVLGGAVSRRQWSNPVDMTEVLRSAIAEVEQYSRVKLVPPIDGELRGHAVADVIHLLAELIENATVFSAPHTQVLLRADLVTAGLAVEVEDRGLGMPVTEQNRMNALLADPDQVNVASLLADGRIGLYVVSQLARRHGIHVRLQSNIYGGVQAVLVVPQALLGGAPAAPGADAAPPPQPQSPAQTPGGGPGAGIPEHGGAGRVGTALTGAADLPVAGDATGAGAMAGAGAGSPPVAGSPAMPGSPAAPGSGAGPDRDARSGSAVAGAPEAGAGAGQAPATGRRRHAQRGPGRHGAESGAGRSGADSDYGLPGADSGSGGRTAEGAGHRAQGGVPAPLPVRGARETRLTPAAALPGVSAADRPVVEAHAGILPTPRTDAVRGTMGKPQLPRRRAQEHLVPQLRGGPAPRQGTDTVVGHDPGLMAAFQRGIGLAEARQHLEATYGDPAYGEQAHGEQAHGEPAYEDSACGESARVDSTYGDLGYEDPASGETPAATEPSDMGSPHMGPSHMGSPHTDAGPMDAEHMPVGHLQAPAPQATQPTRARPALPGPHHPDPLHTDPHDTGPEHQTPAPTASGHTASGHTASDHTASEHMASGHTAPAPTPQPHPHLPGAGGSRGAGRSEGSAPAV